jgi:ABC-type transporter Mla MlaB component
MDPLMLPEELTIYAAGELRPQWLAWLDRAAAAGADAACVQGAQVAEVDGAGLQLLLALRRSLAERGLRLQLADASPALQAACAAAGLADALATAGAAA